MTAEMLSGTIISVNQLSVYGAIADWCGKLGQQISDNAFSSTWKHVAQMSEHLDCELSPEVSYVTTKPLEIDVLAQRNLLRRQTERFENLPDIVMQTGETSGFMSESFSWTLVAVIWMDVAEVPEHAETPRDEYSVPVGSQDRQRPAQYVKSESRIMWTIWNRNSSQIFEK